MKKDLIKNIHSLIDKRELSDPTIQELEIIESFGELTKARLNNEINLGDIKSNIGELLVKVIIHNKMTVDKPIDFVVAWLDHISIGIVGDTKDLLNESMMSYIVKNIEICVNKYKIDIWEVLKEELQAVC